MGSGAAMSAVLRTQAIETDHESPPTSSDRAREDHSDEPTCSICGQAAGRFTRFEFLPPPRRKRRRLYLPRDKPG
jgi:hypothetical protein